MPDSLWQLDGVTLAGSPSPRLAGVSLTILPGVTAVLGRSGAGKTSLLNLLVGFESPDAGQIEAGPLLKANPHLPLFWSPSGGAGDGLWPQHTARDHLRLVAPSAASANIDATLAAFDLTPVADAKPHRLSQGERSRLTVARALASGAKVLVMDEPLAHVEPARIGAFWSVIRGHIQSTGASLIFSTHHADTVLAEASQVICMNAGRVVYHGDVTTLYRHPPTLDAARCLGEVNWLSPDEAAIWLGDGWVVWFDSRTVRSARSPTRTADGAATTEPHTPFIRPEHLDLTLDPQSPIAVESLRFRGTISDVQLLHTQHQLRRSFTVRSPSAAIATGDRVSLRVLLLVFICLLLTACGPSGDPALDVKSFRYQVMPAAGATLPTPRAIALGNNGELIVLDKAGRVLIFSDTGELKRQWWMPEYQKGMPEGACLMKDGRIAVADTHYSRVVIFDQEGNVDSMFGTYGEGPGQFIYPVKVVEDDAGFLYVVEYGGNDRVQKFKPDGTFVLQFGGFDSTPGKFSRAAGIAWHEGKVYVADADNHRVQAFHDDGRLIGVLTDEGRPLVLDFPYDLSIGPDGLLYIIEYGAGRLTALTTEGKLIGRYGTAGRGQGEFSTPWGIRVDKQKRVWIADTGNRRLVELKL